MTDIKDETIILSDFDRSWRKTAEEKRKDLKKIFGTTALEIVHIGSTSIKGIKANPIIDIMVVVRNFESIVAIIPKLEKNGIYKINTNTNNSEMLFCCGDKKNNFKTFVLYVVLKNSREYANHLNFKDYLNVNALKRREYEKLKINLAARYPENMPEYNKGKAEFIKKILSEAYYWRILGKTVTVSVTHPMGSPHERFPDTLYDVNCGYVYGSRECDGSFTNAYILGEKKPVHKFTGRVLAVITGKEDDIKKWVVSPSNKIFYKPDIKQAVNFEEKHRESDCICLYEKSCGAVVYRINNGEPQYLLIRNMSKNIGFPKGHMEFNENEQQTAEREIFEETNLKVQLDEHFRESYNFNVGFFIKKQTVYFLGKIESGNIQIPENEILSYHLVNFKEAMHLLSYTNERKILKNAHIYIKSNLI